MHVSHWWIALPGLSINSYDWASIERYSVRIVVRANILTRYTNSLYFLIIVAIRKRVLVKKTKYTIYCPNDNNLGTKGEYDST
jgi:hypothetical protein